MKEDNWSSEFRERMDDYTIIPPDEVWDKLDKELSSDPIIKMQKRSYTAIAAVIILLLLSSVGLYLLTYYKPDKNIPEILSENTQVLNSKSENTPIPHNKPNIARQNISIEKKTASPQKVKSPQNIVAETVDNAQTITDMKADSAEKKEILPQKKKEYPISLTDNIEKTQEGTSFNTKRKNNKNKWAISIAAGNNMMASNESHYGFGNLNSSNGPMPSDASIWLMNAEKNTEELKAANAYGQIMFKNINHPAQTQIKHHLPITVGVAIRKSIHSQFSIETGLMYTLLSSDLKAGNESYYSQEQKLHYLGIPLKINWNFIQKKYFTVYLSAGGMMEGCVSSQLTTNYEMKNEESFSQDNELKSNRLQWSVSGSAGAQYNINRHIGIFIEPGIVYYFDDGSQIATIRKEKPLNINLQTGLRFGF